MASSHAVVSDGLRRSDVDTQQQQQQHKQLRGCHARLLRLSFWVRLLSLAAALLAAALQQHFDTSAQLLSLTLDPRNAHGFSFGPLTWLQGFVRWDTIYFLSIASPQPLHSSNDPSTPASGGYQYEQMLAFQPGIPALLRIAGYLTPDLEWSPAAAVAVSTLLANLAALITPLLLFQLTWRHTASLELSWTSAALSLFCPAGGTNLSSPTPEPFFSLFALLGMLILSPRSAAQSEGGAKIGRRLLAACCFALATAFRANGVLLAGFLLWDVLWLGADSWAALLFGVPLATFLATISSSPFLISQLWAFKRFCHGSWANELRPWCRLGTRSVYSFVQSHYWDVGLFRYWSPQQLPNFLLAAPVLLVSAYAVASFYGNSSGPTVVRSLLPAVLTGKSGSPTRQNPSSRSMPASDTSISLASHRSLTPHIVLTVVLTAMLLFASHVQIALRFATQGALPAFYWGLASIVLSGTGWLRNAALGWLAIWYACSIVLYAGFYPPA